MLLQDGTNIGPVVCGITYTLSVELYLHRWETNYWTLFCHIMSSLVMGRQSADILKHANTVGNFIPTIWLALKTITMLNYENHQQDAPSLYRLIYYEYSKSALHVSGNVFAHNQEHLTVFTVSGSVHPSCCRLLSRMSWNASFNSFGTELITWRPERRAVVTEDFQ
jgi:hypothetical protein